MDSQRALPICAVSRTDPGAADALLRSTADRLMRNGVRLAGVLQSNTDRPDRTGCDMDLVDLVTGDVIRISENRGTGARSCRLDTAALAGAGAKVIQQISGGVDLVILNKFGKAEAEGRGMRDVIIAALDAGVPLLIGVSKDYASSFVSFAGDLALVTEPENSAIETWLMAYT